MQSGFHSLSISSIGFLKACMDMKNGKIMAGDLSELTFSQPSGNPASRKGKSMMWAWIGRPCSASRFILSEKRGAFSGVVMMVDLVPLRANSLAMSTSGIMWP
ncbi:hypothetical protein LINGRAHAP2_LOCUS4431 [Linum grandiflorum]